MAQQVDDRFARHFLERLYSAVNAHDENAVAELCAKDILWKDPAAPGPLRGREAVARFHRDFMFQTIPDVRIHLIDGPCLSSDGTSVAVRLRIAGTMAGTMSPPGFAPTGGPVEFETAEFSRFEGDQLSRHTVVVDMLGVARQIGAVPASGSLAERVGVLTQRFSARRSRKAAIHA